MIEFLKGVTHIGGHEICVMDELRDKYPEKFNESGAMDYKWFESELRDKHDIFLRHDKDSLTFNIITAPVSEGGKGCQAIILVEAALIAIKHYNSLFPCRENSITITKLEEALMWQEARTKDRVKRNVEGKNLA